MKRILSITLLILFLPHWTIAGADSGITDVDRRHAGRLLNYLGTTFGSQISAVTLDREKIVVRGQITGTVLKLGQTLALAEVPMWEDATALHHPATVRNFVPGDDGQFTAVVDRRSANRDRLLSAWALVVPKGDGYELASSLRYVETLTPRANLPAAKPRSIKGLCGCPIDHTDMKELGVASMTQNIVLNEIIHSQPAVGRSAYDYAGRTWFIDDRSVARFDHIFKTAAELNVMVSAIILIAPVAQAPAGEWVYDTAFPNADPKAMYTMPNFTSEAGVNAYAAVMNFLAERYSQPDGRFGRIHHWILHNEVDSGFYWTNAGDKSLITYLDLYQKSLRLTWLIARQYDPNAKPLISLDHHWAKNPHPRGYPAREMLEQLVDFSRKEGDFAWGIAFHPYPQDLMNPRTWADSNTPDSLDAPIISFRNIEQLERWDLQPQVMFHGTEAREIQLSEQGLNSRDYSDQSFTEQSAGLVYAWKKIVPLKTVTAFQYHRWMDARGEGGLRIGLRRFSDDPQDPGGRKPCWAIFKSLGTDQEARETEFAKPIIGIKQWDEIFERR